ncbi:MAG TPA: cobalamin-binding protein [Acidisarcina sp.]|nr:cobalamin-binding protein [Acidisarcina sp.]
MDLTFAAKSQAFPSRIVCLSDEASELLYLMGEQERIVGVSGFSTRPPEVRSKPRVSTFRDANFEAIEKLDPDLIITYSDVQAEITKEAIQRGLPVLNFNQRSVSEIFEFIALIARLVNQQDKGRQLIAAYEMELQGIANAAAEFARRPRVFFEEWNDPIISGIGWVEELIEIAGGEPIFPELRKAPKAKDRVVFPEQVIKRNPDVIIASWCGMKVKKESICSRAGWDKIPAVRNGHVYEIPSSHILQPGPACLTDGVRELHRILASVTMSAS